MRAKAFRKMAETLQAEGKTAEALLQMQHYAEAMELTVTSDTRADLLEIEKRYDCSALERQNDAFRNRWALTVLLTVAVLSPRLSGCPCCGKYLAFAHELCYTIRVSAPGRTHCRAARLQFVKQWCAANRHDAGCTTGKGL